jgi:hypothetical protein
VSRLEQGSWLEVAIHGEDEAVRLEPFPAVEIDLRSFWTTGSASGRRLA